MWILAWMLEDLAATRAAERWEKTLAREPEEEEQDEPDDS